MDYIQSGEYAPTGYWPTGYWSAIVGLVHYNAAPEDTWTPPRASRVYSVDARSTEYTPPRTDTTYKA